MQNSNAPDNKDILQIDAGVIRGLLIFLTFSFVEPPPATLYEPAQVEPPPPRFTGDLFNRVLLTVVMIIPFVLSATFLLAIDGEERIANTSFRRFARLMTASGCPLIVANLILLLISLR